MSVLINRSFGRLLLGLTLSILLGASVIPSSYAAESFRTFSGSSYIEVPPSPGLQLAQFTLEAKFRVAGDLSEREYLVSKGASDDGSVQFDQNYALYLMQYGGLGGGFKATDGSYYYINSKAVSPGTWHVAKLVYDGINLRLFVDGTLANSTAVAKTADTSDAGPLMIGANAKKIGNFFTGDLDYVKVMDRSIYKVRYYNNFDTGASPGPSPGPIPKPTPGPTPSPSPAGDCSDIPMSQLRGVDFMDPILTRNERGDSVNAPVAYVQDSLKRIQSYGFNLIRVPYYWESYVYNPADFTNRLDLIARTAQENDICVVFDNHHWFTSSYWKTDIGMSGKGIGFPAFVVKNFPSKATYSQTAGPFWEALLSNTIVIDGRKIWDIQAEFLTKVVSKVDKYDSVAGYEILNEPHLWSKDQYEKLGNYHTFMAQKIRAISDKKIIFDRETTHEFMRDPAMEYKILPRGVSKLVYGPHLYSAPTEASGGEKQISNIMKWSEDWGVEIMIGEFSARSQTDMNAFLKAWKEAGFGWTYWKWSKATATRPDHLGNVVYESGTVPKTEALRYLINSYNAIY